MVVTLIPHGARLHGVDVVASVLVALDEDAGVTSQGGVYWKFVPAGPGSEVQA